MKVSELKNMEKRIETGVADVEEMAAVLKDFKTASRKDNSIDIYAESSKVSEDLARAKASLNGLAKAVSEEIKYIMG